MIPKHLNDIGEEDLLQLIDVGESKQLEFKENLGAADEDIKEFLKDGSAKANAIGGDVIYGVVQSVDENGNTVATSVDGLAGVNADDFFLRLENLIRDLRQLAPCASSNTFSNYRRVFHCPSSSVMA